MQQGDDLARAGFGTLFCAMTAHLLMETARDALFLASVPARRLPLAYLAITTATLGLIRLERHLRGRYRADRVLAGWLVVGAVGTLGFWALLPQAGALGLYALYVWPAVVVTFTLVRFWTLLGSRVAPDDARRAYAVVGAGGIAGALVGSGAATVLSGLTSPRHLLLAAAALLFVAGAGPFRLRGDGEPPPPTRPLLETVSTDLRDIANDPYATHVALLVFVSTGAATLSDYLFKSTAAAAVPDEGLGMFFGGVYLALNASSLVVQVLLVPRLVKVLDVPGALAVLPVLFALGGLVFVATGAVVAAACLKIADGSLKHSLHHTATELLYVPMSERERARLKAVGMVVGQRGGQATASVALLVAGASGIGDAGIGLGLVLLAVAWVGLARALRDDRPGVEGAR